MEPWACPGHIPVKSVYQRYHQGGTSFGTHFGAQTAQRILAAAGIRDVSVVAGEGLLSDHYDPVHRRLVLFLTTTTGFHRRPSASPRTRLVAPVTPGGLCPAAVAHVRGRRRHHRQSGGALPPLLWASSPGSSKHWLAMAIGCRLGRFDALQSGHASGGV
ncbi:MAG: zinc metallopeptidase [Verrucomicrobiales bacterium]